MKSFNVEAVIDKISPFIQYNKNGFVLRNGSISPFYINMKNALCTYSLGYTLISYLIMEESSRCKFDDANLIAGIELGSALFVPQLALFSTLCSDFAIVRNKTKQHGVKDRVIKPYSLVGKKIVLFEDVVTSGSSLLDAKNVLENDEGAEIIKMISIIGKDSFEHEDYDYLFSFDTKSGSLKYHNEKGKEYAGFL